MNDQKDFTWQLGSDWQEGAIFEIWYHSGKPDQSYVCTTHYPHLADKICTALSDWGPENLGLIYENRENAKG